MATSIVILEATHTVNQFEEYAGIFFCRVDNRVTFQLPGRGGRVTKKAALKIQKLWDLGTPIDEISNLGYPIAI